MHKRHILEELLFVQQKIIDLNLGDKVKKNILIVSLIALSLVGCVKKDSTDSEQGGIISQAQMIAPIQNQFVYNATSNIKVSVSEFVNEFGNECVTVHANYIYDSSRADIFCIDNNDKKTVDNNENQIVKQFTYYVGKTPVQVTMIRTKKNNSCTIVHANYMYDRSTANISCNL